MFKKSGLHTLPNTLDQTNKSIEHIEIILRVPELKPHNPLPLIEKKTRKNSKEKSFAGRKKSYWRKLSSRYYIIPPFLIVVQIPFGRVLN